MAGDAGRLVDDEEVPILENDGAFNLLDLRFGRRPGIGGLPQSHRWNTDLIAACDARVGLGTFTVDAHFSGTQNPINQALRNTF